ncbi:MAG: linear amide C-N hydrolase [Legionella sp.]|nr:linear amide C-N hydrolase [Legionella sp.]
MNIRKIVILSLACLISSETTFACSRFTYTSAENTVVTGRSFDWMEDAKTDIWAFPAGLSKVGGNAENSVKWKSKYGSVVASAYNMAVVDGINTKGLNANLLYLATSDYGQKNPDHINISIYNWVPFVLDNYASVDEVVKGLTQQQFNMLAPPLPNGMIPPVHLAVTDPSGDNAVFEYIDGKLVTHHGKQYKVMTNEPTYDKQLALNDYWTRLKGEFLPGTGEPDDRFVRATFYVSVAPPSTSIENSVAIVFSIIRNLSVPIIAKTPDRPNVAPTIWRSVSDLKNKLYFFESANRPNVFWVDLNKLNLGEGASVKKLPLSNNEVYAGDTSARFVDSQPFVSP